VVKLFPFSGEVFVCELPHNNCSVKMILDRYMRQMHKSPRDRRCLKLSFNGRVLDEEAEVDANRMPDLSVVQCRETNKVLTFATSGHEDDTKIGEFVVVNSRTAVVAKVGNDICPTRNTNISCGSLVTLVLRGEFKCLRGYEIGTRPEMLELQQALELSTVSNEWRTNRAVTLKNWEDCGERDVTLPDNSILRASRRRAVYGMQALFDPREMEPGNQFLFEIDASKAVMSELNLLRTPCVPTILDLEGSPINDDLVQYPRAVGIPFVAGGVMQADENALDIRSKTGLNALMIRKADGSEEWAPTSEFKISKGSWLFFLKGHRKKVEDDTDGGVVKLEGKPFFSEGYEAIRTE
jgi:hypothetical protein